MEIRRTKTKMLLTFSGRLHQSPAQLTQELNNMSILLLLLLIIIIIIIYITTIN